jgi:hypothetical protein
MRKSIIQITSNKDLKKFVSDQESGSQIEENDKTEQISNTKNDTEDNGEESNTRLQSKSNLNEEEKISIKDKYRKLKRKKEIYDSLSDEEYENENDIGYYISPNSHFIKIFDYIVFISSMIYFIFVPYFLSINYFIIDDNKIWKIIFLIIDIIYIIDILINFFRAYKNFDENLIRRTKKIILHYLKTWFLLDFIQAVPYFSIIKYLEKVNETNSIGCKFIEYRATNAKIYVLLLIKIS